MTAPQTSPAGRPPRSVGEPHVATAEGEVAVATAGRDRPGVETRGGAPAEWRIDLPWRKPPLSMNDRGHWAGRAATVSMVRFLTQCFVSAKVPRLRRVAIELHYAPRDKRRRDPLNLVATLKACEDGIVDAGVIPDDTPQHSVPTMPIIDPPTGSAGRMWLVIREVP